MEAVSNGDRIELIDDKILNNEEFKKNVAIPYFKDIFKDLVSQSDDKNKGINKITLLTYTNLPGIIGERFFAVLDLSKNDYIDLREFVHGFFKVYYSNLETKIKLSFDVYDFDRDGYITKEDVRLILSHIPIVNTVTNPTVAEGTFTRDGGGNQVFLDRV
jgi:Ca2+-binding EF-hand superfamily protein